MRGDQAWVRHYHPAVDVRVLPEYVFVHRQDPGGLFVAFYQYFVARWDDPAIPEYDLLTGDLVHRDGARPDVVGVVPIQIPTVTLSASPRFRAVAVVLRQNSVRRQVIDLAGLIQRKLRLDGHPAAPP